VTRASKKKPCSRGDLSGSDGTRTRDLRRDRSAFSRLIREFLYPSASEAGLAGGCLADAQSLERAPCYHFRYHPGRFVAWSGDARDRFAGLFRMGRAGIEPATLGLKGPKSGLS